MAAVLPASATSAKSADRVTFGIAPASARGPNGRSYLSYGVTPGALLSDHVAVLNYSTIPLSLQVYVTNATETSSGGFGLAPAGQTPTGLESWVSVPLRLSTVSVPARSSAGPGEVVIPLTVRIPDNATPGDRVGGVVASLRTVGTNATGQRVILLQHVGTRLFIRVNGKLAPRLTIADLQTAYQGTLNPFGQGQVRVSYLVHNTGNVDLALGHQADLGLRAARDARGTLGSGASACSFQVRRSTRAWSSMACGLSCCSTRLCLHNQSLWQPAMLSGRSRASRAPRCGQFRGRPSVSWS